MIRIEGVHKTYGDGVRVHALSGVDLHIKKGEFVSIMGPSGSGKSTLLHLIGVLDRQTEGVITLKGADIGKMSDEERTGFRLKEIGFVFQFYSLLPELTALENAFIPAMLYGKNAHECIENAKELLIKLGIGERLNNYPHQLSGGEQQRVSIARALINRPELLLADEPTASLDSKSALNVINILRRLNEEISQTIVLITHEENLGRMADRGIWLKDGQIDKEKSF
ncbi:MAG: ABC transporter ATP-binding protein [Candidatus Aenigmarchaeota archaeon]|nr:ABC transporter ATP-binding protein [Candidatus Aenigmarchaeota archaeon]MDI6722766.1 ABC transporter ATP-binding protein [Candidatus Aenigmarchaeota archaeon]